MDATVVGGCWITAMQSMSYADVKIESADKARLEL